MAPGLGTPGKACARLRALGPVHDSDHASTTDVTQHLPFVSYEEMATTARVRLARGLGPWRAPIPRHAGASEHIAGQGHRPLPVGRNRPLLSGREYCRNLVATAKGKRGGGGGFERIPRSGDRGEPMCLGDQGHGIRVPRTQPQ
jgi:hypothetical protein